MPGLLSGMSACALLPAASFSALGMPRAILDPSGAVTKAPSSLAAVSRVRIWPKAMLMVVSPRLKASVHCLDATHVFARTPN